ncbi:MULTISPECIES: RNase A-like domain-containing protein [unclassified Enterococcus]|uniref:RNase A-like domain-containing protein n=1 Tax=unclassified Enterococcus TaxID=2608891 RepID=UPI001A9B4FC9|nr:RNase A-like domain-containing protein [Enterococcus sp. DIV1271a]MBO1301314.1 hypothetical protein [Enterococcus sp. DIV1271a]
MKKFYHLLLVGLLLAPFATLPLDVHAQESIASEITQPDETVVPIDTTSPIPSSAEPQNAAVALNVFNGMSMSAFASGLSGSTLSAGLLSTTAAAVLAPALLGIGLGVGFYQLGASLGVATADLAKTNSGLFESIGSSAATQNELNAFAMSGIDSTTNTYNFSAALQSRYAQDVTSNALMREYLTGESDHGIFSFNVSDRVELHRRYINYTIPWALREQAAVVGRNTSLADSFSKNEFFVLESIQYGESVRGADDAILNITGSSYYGYDFPEPFNYQVKLDTSISTLLTEITTKEQLLDYVQATTPFEFGVVNEPSKALAIETAKEMAVAYYERTSQISQSLSEALAPNNNGLDFDPSGMIATLYGAAVVLNHAGNFIYAQTQQAVPAHLVGAIEFSYSEGAIPYDDSITIDGKRGVLDEETGNIIDDKTKEILVLGAMGASWLSESLEKIYTKIKELVDVDVEEIEWYTPIDLYYDEHFADGGKGHTIAKHIGKNNGELKNRLDLSPKLNYTSTFNDPIQALVYINIAIFTANQNYLDGKIRLPLGECHLQTSNDRVIYQSHAYISGIVPNGWGLWRIVEGKNEYLPVSNITYSRVIIQRTRNVIRKKRKYYILTAYPDLKRMIEMNPLIAGSIYKKLIYIVIFCRLTPII